MDLPWLQILVYAQPFLWMILYSVKIPLKPKSVQVILFGVAGVLAVTGWGSGFYSNTLLIFYTLSVLYVIHYYRFRPDFQPVSLAFLIVFLSSFYWEVPIHIADLLELDSFGVVAVQALHLIPLPFLLTLGLKVPQRWWYWSVAAWAAIAAIEFMYMQDLIPLTFRPWILYLSRLIGLYTLLWILRFPGQAEDKIICKIRELLVRYDHRGAKPKL